MKYSAEVDGLRSLAVVAVVVYHADLVVGSRALLPGGFLGVDVFFVISGYLITSIIASELSGNRFSLWRFYERRARRILPALLLVIACCFPAAWLFVLPAAFEEFGRTAVGAVLSSSNVLFWLQDSYIAEASAYKPLLHTWSLGIEEQFYILFPLLLIGMMRVSVRGRVIGLGLLAAGSLALAHWVSLSAPDAAFFLLPFRAWELLAGAILALWLGARPGAVGPRVAGGMGVLGLMGIGLSMLVFDEGTRHPSLLTLVPVVGTLFVLVAARAQTGVVRLLAAGPMVYVGKRSYSFYLWHYPIFAFAKLQMGGLTPVSAIGFAGVAFLLSMLSYTFVEQPFRQPDRVQAKQVVRALTLGAVLIAAAGFVVNDKSGFPGRLPPHLAHLAAPEFNKLVGEVPGRTLNGEPMQKCFGRSPATACQFGPVGWVLLGDSHADVLSPAFRDAALARGDGVRVLTHAHCPFLSDGYWVGTTNCARTNALRRSWIEALDTPTRFVVTADSSLFNNGRKRREGAGDTSTAGADQGVPASTDEILESHRAGVQYLLELGHEVVLVYELPTPVVRSREAQALRGIFGAAQAPTEAVLMETGQYEQIARIDALLDVPDHPRLTRVFPKDIFCPETTARRCLAEDENGPIFNRGRHLSRPAADAVISVVLSGT